MTAFERALVALAVSVSCAFAACQPSRGPATESVSQNAARGPLTTPSADAATSAPVLRIEAALPRPDDRTLLREGWRLAPSSKVHEGGAAISIAGYRDDDWLKVRVPNTVLGALVEAGVYRDPYKSDNLRRIPAASFARSWWYRRDLDLSVGEGDRVMLGFDGINYRANVWLNGKLLASDAELRGAFRTYRFDVTNLIDRKGKNGLAVEVFRPTPTDLAINWWDWVFSPPDLNMGLFQDVHWRRTGAVRLDDVRITTKVPSLARADVSVEAVVVNATEEPRSAVVDVALGNLIAEKTVSLAARESKTVVFDPATTPVFSIERPKLWWPVGLGRPDLHDLVAKVTVEGRLSDRRAMRVGLREVTSEVTDGARLFRVNGKPFFLRGGGWASDLLLRRDEARMGVEIAYALHLGLNTIRLEGKLESDAFYDRADEVGIVLLPGWMCCDIWEKQKTWTDTHRSVARESMHSQAERMRNHPSVWAFLIGSDKAPPPDVQRAYDEALESVGWPNAIVNAASKEGESGLKMSGPYDWVPPAYWFERSQGGAVGFNSETGPGAAIPELESMRDFLSTRELEKLWKEPAAPQFHAGAPGHEFETIAIFQRALRARLGAPTNLERWTQEAELMNYEAERAEFEAYAGRKYRETTGIVHWLLNSPWPSLIWHLYEPSLLPAAGFYAAKKANEPIHAMLAYDDGHVIVVNNTNEAEAHVTVVARVLGLAGEERTSSKFEAAVGADASQVVGSLDLDKHVGIQFIELELRRKDELVSTNTYWIPEKKDVMNLAATTWLNTPTTRYADLTGLMKLAKATVKATDHVDDVGRDTKVTVTLENRGSSMGFFLRLTLRRGRGGPAVVPIFWDDNYVTLRPGATRTLTVHCPREALQGSAPAVDVEGINVDPIHL